MSGLCMICRLVIPVVFVMLSGMSYAAGNTPVKKGRPNIIIIMADDLDSRQLSCYGERTS
ncbi:hypothetical protein [Niabella hibiscisoli]|uniref:hypothetical protein n=1 Tax=Niabella hibiscisoli TaxID=1825928 RepID=UPI001F0EF41B|nr:hypothetical protein [Niabella hibiscisoli]MCH5719473.1 hypothetical protein [Niabella hibiscisoli]